MLQCVLHCILQYVTVLLELNFHISELRFAVCCSARCSEGCSVLPCVASVCCSVLQVCCSVLQRVAACCSVLQRVAVCCSVLQCVAACCRMLQCVAIDIRGSSNIAYFNILCVAVCCSVLRYVAACCNGHTTYLAA